MVYFNKSETPPDCLEKEKKKASGTYRCDGAIQQLNLDFHGKCYICEHNNLQNINIEHLEPHKGDRNKMFDWNNLFLSCGHCNSTKNRKEFENILNCTNKEDMNPDFIHYGFVEFAKERTKVVPLNQDERVVATAKLIQATFEGTTSIKKLEASSYRADLLKEILEFEKLCSYN
jgi:uncharacterized protein (TIGR02646 family)